MKKNELRSVAECIAESLPRHAVMTAEKNIHFATDDDVECFQGILNPVITTLAVLAEGDSKKLRKAAGSTDATYDERPLAERLLLRAADKAKRVGPEWDRMDDAEVHNRVRRQAEIASARG